MGVNFEMYSISWELSSLRGVAPKGVPYFLKNTKEKSLNTKQTLQEAKTGRSQELFSKQAWKNAAVIVHNRQSWPHLYTNKTLVFKVKTFQQSPVAPAINYRYAQVI